MKRPEQPYSPPLLSESQIAAASYEGAPDHKAKRWWGGLPGARPGPGGSYSRPGKQRTTICPLVTKAEREQATLWVQEALRTGNFKRVQGDRVFPRYLWLEDGTGNCWMGRLINSEQGTYKGWPIERGEYDEISS